MAGIVEILILSVLIILGIVIVRFRKHSNRSSMSPAICNPGSFAATSEMFDKTTSENKSKICSKCDGTGKITCPWCHGYGKRICGFCGGSGHKYVGITRFNLSGFQNCTFCFAGRTNCNCMGGKVVCSLCGGKGIL